MADRVDVINKISEGLSLLVRPVSEQEAADGWTPKSKSAMQTFFEELRQKLLLGETSPPLSIARGMNHWGITQGELLEKAADISKDLRKIK